MAAVDPNDVTALLDAGVSALHTEASTTTVVELLTMLARSCTRGNGFDGAEPNTEIAAVITLAAARLAANPSQFPNALAREKLTIDTRGGFVGWSLAELAVLNRYRVRAM
ncbi:hypothetical protein PR370_15810 [Mycobacterium marinum]|uniref:hypothetical protein n=1 Tax=Mycobacterium marinum TaxID=1781 RepID=UPI0023581E94|nr:hypothetical protein [Mycobacterium marinum]MDC8982554.1 hypothetical protein [Mycobacterium marinum]MDC8999068.1 hypothetical protein [Mycobacterium marinum]MDC9011510.1 hypothetical protein [Mycobacterium marinum]